MATKWGIVGTGKIASDFANALSTLPGENHAVVAVAARKADVAKKFAQRFLAAADREAPSCKTYGSFQELAKDPEVQVAYVGVVTPAHARIVKMMLNHGQFQCAAAKASK